MPRWFPRSLRHLPKWAEFAPAGARLRNVEIRSGAFCKHYPTRHANRVVFQLTRCTFWWACRATRFLPYISDIPRCVHQSWFSWCGPCVFVFFLACSAGFLRRSRCGCFLCDPSREHVFECLHMRIHVLSCTRMCNCNGALPHKAQEGPKTTRAHPAMAVNMRG